MPVLFSLLNYQTSGRSKSLHRGHRRLTLAKCTAARMEVRRCVISNCQQDWPIRSIPGGDVQSQGGMFQETYPPWKLTLQLLRWLRNPANSPGLRLVVWAYPIIYEFFFLKIPGGAAQDFLKSNSSTWNMGWLGSVNHGRSVNPSYVSRG